jgi:hypothetical protein
MLVRSVVVRFGAVGSMSRRLTGASAFRPSITDVVAVGFRRLIGIGRRRLLLNLSNEGAFLHTMCRSRQCACGAHTSHLFAARIFARL